jgi:tRNA (mo5U34)-methyltransferase
VSLFDRELLYSDLTSLGHGEWADELRRKTEFALSPDRHGMLNQWIDAWKQLPECESATLTAADDAVKVEGTLTSSGHAQLQSSLQQFHPWRKGPFEVFGVPIDTEWRSCLKWNRLAPHVDLRERRVLDVGCGNGYYGWKMLHHGAKMVLGLDPFLLFLMQFESIRKYVAGDCRHFLLPLTDADLPQRLALFDVTFSMGVLYHRTSPIDHLQSLWQTIVPNGTLVLETLVLDSSECTVLVPTDRYAKMRNVWFIPSVSMLLLWLNRCGFRDAIVLDVSRTTSDEQRRTDWMTFESLSDFLDPTDSTKTIEGHPSPMRALITAKRG